MPSLGLRNQDVQRRLRKGLFIFGMILIATNLRAPVTAVGPLIPTIKHDLLISSGLAGFLTALPLLAFALLSFLAPRLAFYFGIERTILGSLAFLTAGIWLRTSQGIVFLLIGTLFMGLAIAVCNVLLPSLIKLRFPQLTGLMTGIYITMMNLWGALGLGLSVPMAQVWGWQGALGCWAVWALLATVIWIPQAAKKETVHQIKLTKPKHQLWRSSLAWEVTLFMGVQSFIFYVLVAWLPTILIEQGVKRDLAGWMMSINQLAALPVTLLTPVLAQRWSHQRGFVVFACSFLLIGLSGLIWFDRTWALFWVVMIGVCTGLLFSLTTMFFVLRTRNAQQAAELSGMAQSVGYLLAAVGPTGFGYLHDWTHQWSISLMALLVSTVLLFFIGWGAASNRYVNEGDTFKP